MDLRKLLVLAFAASIGQPAIASIHLPCKAPGYTLGFFNGAWTTRRSAEDALNSLAAALPKTYNGYEISTELFYNHTGCDTQGATCLQDLAEVFIQRAQEIDSTGSLASHFELFWEAIGDGNASLTQKIEQIYSGAQSLFDYLHTKMISGIMAGLSYLLSHPPTVSDYVLQDASLEILENDGAKLLLVGHSQGNLFLNHAYDYIATRWGKQDVAAVQIAPASPTLRGQYVLADIDLVINALRIQGGASVPPVNMTLPLSSSDWSGHSLIGTYLDPARGARAQIIGLMKNGLAELSQPPDVYHADRASFTVALTWNGLGDEDLIVFEPDGGRLGSGVDHQPGGSMNGDSAHGYMPEIFYATCNPLSFQTGIYHVSILSDSVVDNKMATLQVATQEDGVIFTKSLSTGPASDVYTYTVIIPAFDIIVTQGASAGEYSISFQ